MDKTSPYYRQVVLQARAQHWGTNLTCLRLKVGLDLSISIVAGTFKKYI